MKLEPYCYTFLCLLLFFLQWETSSVLVSMIKLTLWHHGLWYWEEDPANHISLIPFPACLMLDSMCKAVRRKLEVGQGEMDGLLFCVVVPVTPSAAFYPLHWEVTPVWLLVPASSIVWHSENQPPVPLSSRGKRQIVPPVQMSDLQLQGCASNRKVLIFWELKFLCFSGFTVDSYYL